jgi:hypothetical protein
MTAEGPRRSQVFSGLKQELMSELQQEAILIVEKDADTL